MKLIDRFKDMYNNKTYTVISTDGVYPYLFQVGRTQAPDHFKDSPYTISDKYFEKWHPRYCPEIGDKCIYLDCIASNPDKKGYTSIYLVRSLDYEHIYVIDRGSLKKGYV